MNLAIVSVQPDDLQFYWQLKTQLYNFRKYDLSKYYRVLLFTPYGRMPNEIFYKLSEEFPEAQFFFYVDSGNQCSHLMNVFNYIPLLRPWTLNQHFKAYPELEQKNILYLDSDVIFTKKIDLNDYLNDYICYLSYTGNSDIKNNYLSASYFDKKSKDVLPRKVEAYSKIDVLNDTAKLIGIDRQICEENELNTGGAQYIIKGINAKFWADVMDGCMLIRTHLSSVNRKYFESENKGFQSWCADMWAVLWNLWKRGKQTRCPKELDFAWATDPIEKWDKVSIYHDAGDTTAPLIVDGKEHWLFNKRGQRVAYGDSFVYLRNYTDNEKSPIEDDLSWVSPKFCSYNYVQELINSHK